jgi:hypothetical protein
VPSAAKPQPNFGISPAKHVLRDAEGTQRPQCSEVKGETDLQTFLTFPHNLGAFAPWREKISDSESLLIADHCAGHANFELWYKIHRKRRNKNPTRTIFFPTL